jgi:hypothetical protein
MQPKQRDQGKEGSQTASFGRDSNGNNQDDV